MRRVRGTPPVTPVCPSGAVSEASTVTVRVTALVLRFVTPAVMAVWVRPKANPALEGTSYSTGAVKLLTVGI